MPLRACQLCAVDFTLKRFLLPLVDGLERSGIHVTSVCSDGPDVPGMRADGYRIETVAIPRGISPWSAVRAVWSLTRLFRQERFDFVHVHTPTAALVGRVAARIAGVPFILYTAHGFYFHDQMPGWKRRIFVGLEWIGGCITDLLFCQSAEDARDAERLGLAPKGRVFAIGNGVDIRRFDPSHAPSAAEARATVGIPGGSRVVGIIGRMVREKGYHELLEAAVSLAGEFPDMVVLLVGGRLASDHDASIGAALDVARERLGARLIEAGPRDDTPAMLAAMDVFCLPSYREGMPRTIIEAMMMGKPVIATDIRGCREEVVAGVTGWLVPVRSVTGLADAIRQCLSDMGAARRMGAAGRTRALALYDERRVVEVQVELLRRFLPAVARE